MSTEYKTSKAELVAIYRLEFYKKQKSWKLCKDVRKEAARKKAASVKKTLNQTYDVAAPSTAAAARALYGAFLDSDSDTNAVPKKDDSNSPNPAERCPNTETETLKPETPLVPISLQKQDSLSHAESKWSDLEGYWKEPEVVLQQTEDCLKAKLWPVQKIWPSKSWAQHGGLRAEDGEGEVTMLDASSEDIEQGWPARSQVWTNTELKAADLDWAADVVPMELDEVVQVQDWEDHYHTLFQQWAPQQHVPALAHWSPSPNCTTPPGFDRPWDAPDDMSQPQFEPSIRESAERAREFMAGARAAPHSSELDLRALEMSALEHMMSMSPRSRWVTTPRSRFLSSRSQSLESEDIPPPPPRVVDSSSCDEYPTRDVGLQRPPAGEHHEQHEQHAPPPAPALDDMFVAGSFMNHPEFNIGGWEGWRGPPPPPPPGWGESPRPRGRGRLHNMEDHVVGAGRGRLHKMSCF